MSWYKSGVATFTNGNTSVTGSGTDWIANAKAGEGIIGPDGRVYEIASVNSSTSLTLGTAYLGATAAGASYTIAPTQSYLRDLAAGAAALIASYAASTQTQAGAAQVKATPVDADSLVLLDSANGGLLRKLSWSGIKTALLGGGQAGTFTAITAPAFSADAGGSVSLLRSDTSGEGGQINFKRALDNADAFAIDVQGAGTTPNFRVLDQAAGLTRIILNSSGLVGFSVDAPTYQVTIGGTGQDTPALTDAGNKGGAIYLRAGGAGVNTGGAVLFGSTFGNGTPFAAIKGLLQDGGTNTTGDLSFSMRSTVGATALTERARLTTSGNFGLGVSVPSDKLSLGDGTILAQIKLSGTTTYFGNRSNHEIGFTVNDTERVRVTSGALITAGGVSIQNSGGDYVGANGSAAFSAFYGGQNSNSGAGIVLYGQSNANPNITLFTRGGFVESARIDAGGHFYPGVTNTQTLGAASKLWSTVYAGTGAINTSDARQKTTVSPLTAAELAAASELAASIGTFKFLDSIKAKGSAARTHTGMTVQHAMSVMESHGLDPMAFAFICYDEWEDGFTEHPEVLAADEVINEDGGVIRAAIEYKAAWREQTQQAGNAYAFRMDQLYAFISRGHESRIVALSARLAVLEAA